MPKRSNKSVISNLEERLEKLWSKKNIQIWSSSLAIGTALIYALFGGLSANTEHPIWYRVLTSCILLNLALLGSALLCIRNGFSRRIPSGRGVWLLLGASLLSFLCGSIFFSAWELYWGLNPAGSLGDPFFVMFYIFLPLSILLTIFTKKVRLEAYQWCLLLAAASFASLLVIVITSFIPSVAVAATTDSAPAIQAVEETVKNLVPEWVSTIDQALKPHATNLNFIYVWSDVVLFTLATTIVMKFWGMKLNRAWVINSFAVICFYISDMWFAYAASNVENYQSGFFLEIFWTLGAILFGLAAVTEFDIMLVREINKENLDLEMGTPSDIFYD
jgi:hypothetical protein